MGSVKLLPAVLLCSIGIPAVACEHPPLVQVPSGEAMRGREAEVQDAVARYVAAMQGYVDCIQAELAAAGDTAPELQRAMLVRRNNLAVGEVEAVLKLFNDAVGPAAAAEQGDSNDEREGRRRARNRD